MLNQNVNFIFLKKNAYSEESCKNLISWFENNKHLASKGKAGKKNLDNLPKDLEALTKDLITDIKKLQQSLKKYYQKVKKPMS